MRINGILFFLIIIMNTRCNTENHNEINNVQIDSLTTLPNSFYAFRRGRVYVEGIKPENYRIWYNINRRGIENIFKIEDFENLNSTAETTIAKYNIDTNLRKNHANLFIRLSRKYEFGHISIDKPYKIFFSNRDGLSEQYVYILNDSVKKAYEKNSNFKFLKNRWFKNIAD